MYHIIYHISVYGVRHYKHSMFLAAYRGAKSCKGKNMYITAMLLVQAEIYRQCYSCLCGDFSVPGINFPS